ncbi:MAG TPA: PAS domain S-box protein [Gemmatimonadaceae bacterium]|nr:PAS domain S-box protein [Gemmatimonadaceae bacterium]
MPPTYDPILVSAALVIAALASYVALDFAGRLTAATGPARARWLAGGACAMGIGLWSAHFVGMLSLHLPMRVGYDVALIATSLLVSILISALALAVVSRPRPTRGAIAIAGVLLALAMVVMHVLGIRAMRTAASITVASRPVAASAALSLIVSWLALWWAYRFRAADSAGAEWAKRAAAIVLGAGIVGMHYVALGAVRFFPTGAPLTLGARNVLATDALAGVIVGGVLLVLVLAIASVVMDRRLRHYDATTTRERALRQSAEELRADAERYAQQLQEQALELEHQTDEAQALAQELEQTNEQLQDSLLELERARGAAESARARIAAIFDALPDATNAFDGEWRWTFMNPAAAEALRAAGKDPSTLLGRVLWDELPELRDTPFEEAMRQAVAERRIVEHEGYIPSLEQWLESRLVPVPDGVIVLTRDVTERRRAYEVRERLAAIVDSSDDAIVGKQLDGTIISWNDAATRLFGWSAEEAVGRSIMIIIPPGREHEERDILARLARGEHIDHFETTRQRKDGTLVEVSLSISPVRDERGRVIGAAKIARDITARRRTDEALRAAQDRLRLAVEAADIGTWDFDPVHDVLEWSAQCKAMFALPPDARVDLPRFLSLVHPEDRERVHAAMQSALDPAGAGEFHAEYRTLRPDGAIRWLVAHGRVHFDERNGARRPLRFLGTILDATQRRQAEEALREETRLFETLQRIGGMVTAELEADRLVQLVTDEATTRVGAQIGAFIHESMASDGETTMAFAVSGIPRERFAGLPMPRHTALFGPALRGKEIVRAADVLTDPRYGHLSPFHGLPPGHPPVRSYLAVPVVSRTGAVLGGLFFGHERPGMFTERHERVVAGIAAWAAVAMDNARLYTQERTARAEAQGANRAKSEFLATMSHELRTPLNAIAGYAELLAMGVRGPVTPEQLEDLGRIQRSQRHLLSLINDVLNFAKLEAGHLRLEMRDVAIADLLSGLEVLVTPQMRARELTYLCDGCDSAERVSADPEKVQQILLNLLSNAIKFTDAGGCITVRPELGADTVAIRVSDTGRGVPASKHERIFEPFVQLDRDFTSSHEGTGLGLAISRDLARAMGGDLTIESTEGVGSTFTLTLPRAGR